MILLSALFFTPTLQVPRLPFLLTSKYGSFGGVNITCLPSELKIHPVVIKTNEIHLVASLMIIVFVSPPLEF